MKERFKVIALPTKDIIKGLLVTNSKGNINILNDSFTTYRLNYDTCLHLYIVDVEIPLKEGNTILNIKPGPDYLKMVGNISLSCSLPKDAHTRENGWVKIVASTNRFFCMHQPGIPTSFIQSIVNNQQIPEWVELEMREDKKNTPKNTYGGEVIIKEPLDTINQIICDKHLLPEHYTPIAKPYYKGDGNHSVKELENLCNDFTEYCHQQAIIKNALIREIQSL